MSRKQKEKELRPTHDLLISEKVLTLPTIWSLSDALWDKVITVLAELDPPKRQGRKRSDPRAIFNAVCFRLRTGCQWNHLPREFPDDSTVHRTFQRWVNLGVFQRIWALLVEACGDVGWEWQAADGAMGKARLGGDAIGPNPTDRGKNGTKRSVLVEANGGPLAVVIAGANVHDTKLLDATLQALVVERSDPTLEEPQHLCLDKGYDNRAWMGCD